MKFRETPLAGAFVIDLECIEDDRGFFARAWSADDFVAHGLEATVAQMNMSATLAAGTFRGFHWQDPPFGEIKTVRCIAGSVYNCVVDTEACPRSSWTVRMSAPWSSMCVAQL